jgi:hypothetical protein
LERTEGHRTKPVVEEDWIEMSDRLMEERRTTGEAPFECVRCGACCLHPIGVVLVSPADIARWRREGREDLLQHPLIDSGEILRVAEYYEWPTEEEGNPFFGLEEEPSDEEAELVYELWRQWWVREKAALERKAGHASYGAEA